MVHSLTSFPMWMTTRNILDPGYSWRCCFLQFFQVLSLRKRTDHNLLNACGGDSPHLEGSPVLHPISRCLNFSGLSVLSPQFKSLQGSIQVLPPMLQFGNSQGSKLRHFQIISSAPHLSGVTVFIADVLEDIENHSRLFCPGLHLLVTSIGKGILVLDIPSLLAMGVLKYVFIHS